MNESDSKKPAVLIVDNEPANLKLLSDCLLGENIEVLIAKDGKEGLKIARLALPDLILLDIRMPGIDGFEVCSRLKSDERLSVIPVIFLTSLVNTEDKIKGFEKGAVDFISKPFQVMEVLIRVRTHLALRRANQNLEKKIENRTTDLRKISRMLEILSECNQSVLLASEETDLMNEICSIISHKGNYPCVWIGNAEKDGSGSVCPVAWSERQDGFYFMEDLKVSWKKSKWGKGPTGIAIREGRTVYSGDFRNNSDLAPWYESIRKKGLVSAISIPLRDKQYSPFGALTIYSEFPDNLQSEEIRLLEKIAANLAFGIRSIRSRKDLAESETKYKRIVDTASEGIMSIDLNNRINFVNSRILDILGFEEDEIMGHELREFIHPDQLKDFSRRVNSRKKGAKETFERCYLHKSGERIWANVSAVPVFDMDHQYQGSIAMITDTTEVRKNREQLHILNCAIDKIKEAVFLFDFKGHFIYVNEEACHSLGYNRSELLRMAVFDIDPTVSEDNFPREEWKDMIGGSPLILRTRHRAKNGRVFPVEITSSYIEYSGQLYVLSLAKDITDQNRTSEIKRLIELSAEITEELTSIVSEYEEIKAPPTLKDMGFTPRQIEIARMIVEGAPTKAIAMEMGLSEPTIKSHLSAMYRKMEVSGRMEFGKKIVDMGILLE